MEGITTVGNKGIGAFLTGLCEFQVTASYYVFVEIFGEGMAEYLWSKFQRQCEGNLLVFCALLDSERLGQVVGYLELGETEQGNS